MASSSGGGHEKDQYVLSMQPGTLRQGTVVLQGYLKEGRRPSLRVSRSPGELWTWP